MQNRQAAMDYSVCNAVSNTTIGDIPKIAQFYDVECQHSIYFPKRVASARYLEYPFAKTIYYGVGAFHISGHVPECFPRYSPQFMPGVGIVDGEVLESLWSTLNEVSPSAQTASLAARTELLDDHMLDSNWKKIIHQGMLSGNFGAQCDRCTWLQRQPWGESTRKPFRSLQKANGITKGYVKTWILRCRTNGKRKWLRHKRCVHRIFRPWIFLIQPW
jgi:hypothetical protein